ncbi:bifunctional cobalt-precorrin-7 (C(5))-methyltransferase/cobalt-precorrin-6B (C(15))-methyltransferase [Nonomuraea africana]|uniref:Precorrin-6Y C5,15-methyltransferase (Decarboxylating) n=1 Tax=Nonomuraea africana TaxID=46171 RepID=A0ABR9KVA0_9ACTN|nr:precorrin-6y C5,15-methyltransferase (decarboxylating) subunit CbiE [Nonomuraea africana]MBE1565543.1 precorrin-6Y C5,15-methyltransferase (decarboxylating) [Nonomuraea africana]
MITVVGVGADGWAGLSPAARQAISEAAVLVGSARQLDLVPAGGARKVRWPSPLLPALPALVSEPGTCVLASGDPMFFGIGATLARTVGPENLRILPHPSSLSLACARLAWPVEETPVVSLVGRPLDALRAAVLPGRRVLVLTADGAGPALVAELLREHGYGASVMHVLSRLGSADESRVTGTAASWAAEAGELNVVAIECVADPGTVPLPPVPGLPDAAFEHDGQLTKREVRAVSLARLAPLPGQLLWDVGAGAGSVAIEWMRTHPSCRAIAVESRQDRADRIGRNAAALGVPGLRVVTGRAPGALEGLPTPSAVFVGGGATVPGLLETCWAALPPGGRLVANAVTLESESVLTGWYGRHGGDLVRLAVSRSAPVGGFTGWKSMMPVTIWTATKESGT